MIHLTSFCAKFVTLWKSVKTLGFGGSRMFVVAWLAFSERLWLEAKPCVPHAPWTTSFPFLPPDVGLLARVALDPLQLPGLRDIMI